MSEDNPNKHLLASVVFTPESAGSLTTRRWAVAHTRSRCEKRIAEFFANNRIVHYLPLVNRRSVGNRETRNFQVPLFPGYVFFDTAATDRHALLRTGKVATIIESDEPVALCSQLGNLARAIAQDEFLCEARYGQIGKPIRIARGKLKGLCGEVVRVEGRSRLLIRVDFVGRAAMLDIDESMLEPAF